MKIQLALDRLTKENCIRIVHETYESIDWIEIGTGVIKEYGMEIVREMKRLYPDKTIVADMKTCDAGKHEAKQAFEAGADIITVMAFSHNSTVKEAIDVARSYNKKVMIDLLGIKDRKRVEELYELNVDLFCLHIGKDMQNEATIGDASLYKLIEGLKDVQIAIAGGISEKNIQAIEKSIVDIIIIGSSITEAESPEIASQRLKELIVKD